MIPQRCTSVLLIHPMVHDSTKIIALVFEVVWGKHYLGAFSTTNWSKALDSRRRRSVGHNKFFFSRWQFVLKGVFALHPILVHIKKNSRRNTSHRKKGRKKEWMNERHKSWQRDRGGGTWTHVGIFYTKCTLHIHLQFLEMHSSSHNCRQQLQMS